MKIMNVVIAALVLTFSVGAYAQDTNKCNIDPAWNQETINRHIEECRDHSKDIVEETSRYTEIARGTAEAIGVAAKEIGVSANEFIKTDAGKITIAFIGWYVFGGEIKGIVFGIPLLLLTIFLYSKAVRRILTVEFKTIKGWFGRDKQIPVFKKFEEIEPNEGVTMVLMSIVALIIVIVALTKIL